MPLDILALAAHRDDVEQTCGGTLLKMAERGYRTGILDLTQGEMGTRGTAEDRAREAVEAARILKVAWRQALDIPDGRVENTWANRLKVARVLREQRPRVLILPYWEGRHPDHYTASVLGYEAAFLAGLAKLAVSHQPSAVSLEMSAVRSQLSVRQNTSPEEPALSDLEPREGESKRATDSSQLSTLSSQLSEINDRETTSGPQPLVPAESSPEGATEDSPGRKSGVSAANDRVPQGRHPEGLAPHRPFKIIYASLYRDVRPTFVVDITDQFESRFQALMAYESQFKDQKAGSGIFPAQAEIRARVESMARFYGMQAGVTYAEPFVQKDVGLVDDLLAIPVKSI
jgi:bacillithiol biosynthesis deacetylase BshB1